MYARCRDLMVSANVQNKQFEPSRQAKRGRAVVRLLAVYPAKRMYCITCTRNLDST